MIFTLIFPIFNYSKIYSYSHTLQLRRSTFLNKFEDRLRESRETGQNKECVFLLFKGGNALIYNDIKGLFLHDNMEIEPGTMVWLSITFENNLLLPPARSIYRQWRYNFDLNFMR